MSGKKGRLRSVSFLIIILLAVINIGSYTVTTPTTVLIVRHAEKAASPPDNPPLTAAGQERAKNLIHIVGKAGIKAIYATQYARTQQTVQPLADHLGLTVNKLEAGNTKQLVDEALSKHAGEVILFAGHSNTIPDIITALGGDPISPIGDNDYDNLYIVTIYSPGKAKVVNLKY